MLTKRENETFHDVKTAPEVYAYGENATSFHMFDGGLTLNESNGDISTVALAKSISDNLSVEKRSSTVLMKRLPLWLYIIGVIVALVIVNWIAWLTGGAAKLANVERFSIGFLLGMLAMYIAEHVYR